MDYQRYATTLKAMSDPSRLQIIDMLSCGSLCACDILPHFKFSQPTLSHRMKILQEAGIISTTKKGKWHYYALNDEFISNFNQSAQTLFDDGPNCACHQGCVS
ncbi:ArsR/SmtB family transcription factor [Companilactobacillus versmoldensis]|nr:metalloregulator ArsR/SmtB family transcription factor [Companilactobacillus versmoldensis]